MSEKTSIQCAPDGPLLVRQLAKLVSADGARSWPTNKSTALCRCGASENKPFCDGKHRQAGFSDADSRPRDGVCARSTTPGPGEVRVNEGGPFGARGDVELEGYEGDGEDLWLCRCGASANKPFCDGSHKGVGFEG